MKYVVIVYMTLLVGLCILSSLSICGAIKILLLPSNINSHVLYFARLAESLSEEGHVTNLFTASNGQKIKSSHVNFSVTPYPVNGEIPFMSSPESSKWLMQIALSKSKLEELQIMKKFGESFLPDIEGDCVSLLENKILMDNIRKNKFDFVIIDVVAMSCYAVLPYSLNIPYGALSVAWIGWMYRMPQFPSFSTIFGYTDRMTFRERLTTLLIEFGCSMIMNYSTSYSEIYAPNRTPLNEVQLFQKSSVWIIIEDLSLGYPKPHMPNTVGIGDLMAGQPTKPLPADIQEFISHSPHGFILVSFGSFFDYVPQDVAEKFCNVFRLLKQRVIWKMKVMEYCSNVPNVKIVSWMPQNDLLASESLRVFITHAGLSSVAEALYHAKPLITFPIALDQPYNSVAAEAKGYAIHMRFADFTESQLLEGINKILNDPSYAESARHYSAVMKDKPLTPGQRVSHLITHVVKYGDSHLRTGAYELNTAQFFMFDLFAVIFLSILFGVILVVLCLRCTYRCVRYWCCSRNVNLDKEKKRL